MWGIGPVGSLWEAGNIQNNEGDDEEAIRKITDSSLEHVAKLL